MFTVYYSRFINEPFSPSYFEAHATILQGAGVEGGNNQGDMRRLVRGECSERGSVSDAAGVFGWLEA